MSQVDVLKTFSVSGSFKLDLESCKGSFPTIFLVSVLLKDACFGNVLI